MAAHASFSPLARALRGHSRSFLAIGFFSSVANLLLLTAPLYTAQVYDRVLTTRSLETLGVLSALALGLLLFLAGFEVVRSRLLIRIGRSLNAELGASVFRALFRRAISVKPSRNGSQYLRDLDALRQFLSGQGPLALFDAPWAPIYLTLEFAFHPVLGWLSLAGVILLFLMALTSELLTGRLLRNANTEAVAATGFSERALYNAEAVTSMGLLPGITRRWGRQHHISVELQSRASDRAALITAASKFTRLILQIGIIGAGAALVATQQVTPGVMFAASLIMGRALAPVEQAVGNWRGFVTARAAYSRLRALLKSIPDVEEPLSLPAARGALDVENLSLVLPSGTKVLSNIAFSLEPGEALGVIGPSASGKSCLARMLVGVG